MSGTPDHMATELERPAHLPKLLQMTFTVDETVLRERGMAVVYDALDNARHEWQAAYNKLREADKTWQEKAADAFREGLADAIRNRP